MDGGFFFAVVGIVFYTKYWKEAHTYVLHNTYHVLLKLDWPHFYIKFDYIMIPEECKIAIPRFPDSPIPRFPESPRNETRQGIGIHNIHTLPTQVRHFLSFKEKK